MIIILFKSSFNACILSFYDLFHLIADSVGFKTRRSILKYALNSLTFCYNWSQKKIEQDLVQTDQVESSTDIQTDSMQFPPGSEANKLVTMRVQDPRK